MAGARHQQSTPVSGGRQRGGFPRETPGDGAPGGGSGQGLGWRWPWRARHPLPGVQGWCLLPGPDGEKRGSGMPPHIKKKSLHPKNRATAQDNPLCGHFLKHWARPWRLRLGTAPPLPAPRLLQAPGPPPPRRPAAQATGRWLCQGSAEPPASGPKVPEAPWSGSAS